MGAIEASKAAVLTVRKLVEAGWGRSSWLLGGVEVRQRINIKEIHARLPLPSTSRYVNINGQRAKFC